MTTADGGAGGGKGLDCWDEQHRRGHEDHGGGGSGLHSVIVVTIMVWPIAIAVMVNQYLPRGLWRLEEAREAAANRRPSCM